MTSLTTVTVRNAFSTERGTYAAIVDADGAVRVYDSVAGHYTRNHSLSPRRIARARREAGWQAPRTVRVAVAQVGSCFGCCGELRARNGRVVWSGPVRPHGCDAVAADDARAEAAKRGWTV